MPSCPPKTAVRGSPQGLSVKVNLSSEIGRFGVVVRVGRGRYLALLHPGDGRETTCTPSEDPLLSRNVELFLALNTHGLLYHSSLGSGVIKKEKKKTCAPRGTAEAFSKTGERRQRQGRQGRQGKHRRHRNDRRDRRNRRDRRQET